MTEIFANKRLRGGCSVKDNEAPWVVYIRNCAIYNGIDTIQVQTVTREMPDTTKNPRFGRAKHLPSIFKETTTQTAK